MYNVERRKGTVGHVTTVLRWNTTLYGYFVALLKVHVQENVQGIFTVPCNLEECNITVIQVNPGVIRL